MASVIPIRSDRPARAEAAGNQAGWDRSVTLLRDGR